MSPHSSFITFFLFVFLFAKADFQPEFSIGQDGTESTLTATHTDMTLAKKPFHVSFKCREYTDSAFHAVRVAMFLDKSKLQQVRGGIRTSDIEFFALGTGYATDGPYDPFYIHKEDAGHHYISYQKAGIKRAELVAETEGTLRLRCGVKNLCIDGETLSVEAAKIESLHLVIFYDANLNSFVDEGEYRTVSIRLN